MINSNLLVSIEERINKRRTYALYTCKSSAFKKIDDRIVKAIDDRIMANKNCDTLYSAILMYLKRLNNPKYQRKNGEINEAAFYRDAFIDKSTWSDIRWGKIVPNKKTLLKLVIALRLSEEEANVLMALGSNSLNSSDPRDIVVLALIDIKCYDICDVYDVLEEYGKNGKEKFDNIYDIRE